MKFKNIFSVIILLAALSACVNYLDQSSSSNVVEDIDIFGKYESFQGFSDQCFLYIFEPISAFSSPGQPFQGGDETHGSGVLSQVYWANQGDYLKLLLGPGGATTSLYLNDATLKQGGYRGFWSGSWAAIRIANMGLIKLPVLKNTLTASQEQLNLLQGHNLFFRGYYHYVLMSLWGGLPYIDTVLNSQMNLNFPRPTLKDGLRKAVTDFVNAANLLPAHWDSTSVGKPVPTKNEGRPTKASAFGMAAKTLLFMGSPLNASDHHYDVALCKESAKYGYEVIQLTQQGYHKLLPIDIDTKELDLGKFQTNFVAPTPQSSVFTRENLVTHPSDPSYMIQQYPQSGFAISFCPTSGGGSGHIMVPTENLVERFETRNGLMPEDDPTWNPIKPWTNRDPRLQASVMTDGTTYKTGWICATYSYSLTGEVGRDFGPGQTETGYFIKKYWPYGHVNGGTPASPQPTTPRLRLTEVYLNYAEALIGAGYGPLDEPMFENGNKGISAVAAVNFVRSRIYLPDNKRILPDINLSKYGGAGSDGTVKGSFMEKVWNERSCELCFEMTRWFDLRRWYVAHLPKYRELYGSRFDKNQTKFERVFLGSITFGLKHYWMPIPTSDENLYQAYPQNPGW